MCFAEEVVSIHAGSEGPVSMDLILRSDLFVLQLEGITVIRLMTGPEQRLDESSERAQQSLTTGLKPLQKTPLLGLKKKVISSSSFSSSLSEIDAGGPPNLSYNNWR